MGRLDTRYILKLDTKATFFNPTLSFSINDTETSDLYVRVTNQNKLIDIANMIPVVAIIDPNGQLHSDFMEVTEDNLLYYDIKQSMKAITGKYIAKVMLVDESEKKVLKGNFSYVIEDDEISLLNEKAGEDDRLPILTEFISRLSSIEVNETARQEAEKQREIIKQKLIDDIEKLISDTNKKVDDSLKENSNKVTKLISDTETKIDTYKTEKNTEIDKDLQVYKENTTDDIKTYLDDYKNEKDNIINSKIEELNRTTYNIEESEKDRVKNETLRQNSESTRSKEFETIKSDYETYKNVMISESNVAALQSQINNNSSQIKDIENELGTETLNTTSQNLKSAINEVFQSVSNGKALVASAITDKGVSTSSSDSFSTMATNIRSIPNQGGGITPSGTINITANGTVDVTNYATASINVEGTGDTTIVTTTNTNTLNKRGSKKLSFGVISDIHITTDTTNSANVKFANALDFFEAQSCNFVVMNGDIANYDKANELNTYGTMIADYTLPIYEIMGNHDAGTGTSTTEDEWTTLTGNTFKFEIINNDEVFLFLSQRKWSDYSTAENNRMLTQEDKNWLSGKLESYKNKPRVFLFHHQYLDNCEGFAYRNGTESNSNIVNDVDYWTNIVSTYKNVTWFSGHSHSPFSLQDTYPNNTVYNKNGEYCNMIHVPSLTSGQYYIVTVYDGLFEIQGYEDGTKVDSAYYIIGNYSSSSSSSTEDKTTYTITNNLTNVTNSNLYLSIEEGNAYTATLTATDGYNITSVTVTMGGTDITSTVYSAGNINISSVTGDIVITASAEEIAGTYYTITNNLNNATTSNSATSVEENSSYSATITANNNYELSSITVTMGGIDISSTAVSGANISISSVTGNIIITVTTTAIYTITNTLSNASTNNSSTTAKSGTSYTATITANDGYAINTVTVTMGGSDITSTAYADGVITINSVTGNIVITVTTAIQLNKTVIYHLDTVTGTINAKSGTANISSGSVTFGTPLTQGIKYYIRCDSFVDGSGNAIDIVNHKIYLQGLAMNNGTQVDSKLMQDYTNFVGVDAFLCGNYSTGINDTTQVTGFNNFRMKASSSSTATFPLTFTMTNLEIFTYGESI